MKPLHPPTAQVISLGSLRSKLGRASRGPRVNGSGKAGGHRRSYGATLSPVEAGIVEYLPRLRSFAGSITRDRTKAEDCLQEGILVALEKQHMWDPTKGTLYGWLCTVMRYRYLHQARNNWRKGFIPEDFDFGHIEEGYGPELSDAVGLLRDMPALLKEALLLRVAGHTQFEIARLLNVSQGTIKSRTFRAIKWIKEPGRWPLTIPGVGEALRELEAQL